MKKMLIVTTVNFLIFIACMGLVKYFDMNFKVMLVPYAFSLVLYYKYCLKDDYSKSFNKSLVSKNNSNK